MMNSFIIQVMDDVVGILVRVSTIRGMMPRARDLLKIWNWKTGQYLTVSVF